MNRRNHSFTFTILQSLSLSEPESKFYLLKSTAPKIVDDSNEKSDPPYLFKDVEKALEDFRERCTGEIKQIVIQIHGYSSSEGAHNKNIQETLLFLKKNGLPKEDTILIFYRWPSEIMFSPLKTLPQSIPIPLVFFVVIAVLLLLSTLLPLGLGNLPALANISGMSGKISGLFILSLIITLISLRLVVYFRDSYRAHHYAVPDLIEFIRTIDSKLGQEAREEKKRIKLSFIAHSMGAFVATSSIKSLRDSFIFEKEKSNNIGNNFNLSRLLLVAPDIPVSSLLMLRANFLYRSLCACEEAYLFSNEGDMALRVASTVANFFVFPSKTRLHGYRLGNLSINSDECEFIDTEIIHARTKNKSEKYGALKCKSKIEDVFEIRDSFGNQYILNNKTHSDLNVFKEYLEECLPIITTAVQDLHKYIQPETQPSTALIIPSTEFIKGAKKKIEFIKGEISSLRKKIAMKDRPARSNSYLLDHQNIDIAERFSIIFKEITEITKMTEAFSKAVDDDFTENDISKQFLYIADFSIRQLTETLGPQKADTDTNDELTPDNIVARNPLEKLNAQDSFQQMHTSLRAIEKSLKDVKNTFDKKSSFTELADKFTFFDCTDYEDILAADSSQSNKSKRLLSLGLPNIKFLSLVKLPCYIILLPLWGLGWIDVHGGFFKGDFLKKHIYKLAFLGSQYFLPEGDRATTVENLSLYKDKQIKVFLSKDLEKVVRENLELPQPEPETSVPRDGE